MDLYNKLSIDISKLLTTRYSSSFSASSLLFSKTVRPHIYSIYGLVRVADEIVDTYVGPDKKSQLDKLESEVYDSMKRGYSANPIVHSFASTAKRYGISKSIIAPFFDSMRLDINPPKQFSHEEYRRYIFGSAEVVGLMCLKVFTAGDHVSYQKLESGASHLGAAYQKVNFLRDMADDHQRLSRVYFPGVDYDSFDDSDKREIERDIENDFTRARKAIGELPQSSKRAVLASYRLYYQLFTKLKKSSVETIKTKRLRVPASKKMLYLASAFIRTSL